MTSSLPWGCRNALIQRSEAPRSPRPRLPLRSARSRARSGPAAETGGVAAGLVRSTASRFQQLRGTPSLWRRVALSVTSTPRLPPGPSVPLRGDVSCGERRERTCQDLKQLVGRRIFAPTPPSHSAASVQEHAPETEPLSTTCFSGSSVGGGGGRVFEMGLTHSGRFLPL